MTARWTLGAPASQEITLLGSRGLPRREYFAELAPRLRRAVDSDATCWHTLDPHTRLMTSDAPAELVDRGVYLREEVAAAGELMVRSEYLVDDVNTFAQLARRRTPVGILGDATRGDPRAQRALPRPARALRDPARAARRVPPARAGVGGRAHRPPRDLGAVQP